MDNSDKSVEQFSRKEVRRTSMRHARDFLKTSYIFSNDPKKQDIILQSLDTVHRSLLGVRSINNNNEVNSDRMGSRSDSNSSALATSSQRASTVFDSESETSLTFSSTENNTPTTVSTENNTPTSVSTENTTPTSIASKLTDRSSKKIKRKLRFNLDNVDASKLETLSPVARSVVQVQDVPPTVEGTIVKQIVNCKINILKKNNSVPGLNNSETGKATLVTVRSYTPTKYNVPDIENKLGEHDAGKLSPQALNNSSCQRPTKLDLGVDETDSVIINNIEHNLAESPPKPPRSGKLIWCSTENKLIENPNFETPNKNNLSSNLKHNNSNEFPDLKLNLKRSPDEIAYRTNLKVVNPNLNSDKCTKRLSQMSYLCSPTPYPKFSRLSYDSPNRNTLCSQYISDYNDCPIKSNCSDSCEKNSCSSSSQNNDFNYSLALPIIKNSDCNLSYRDFNRNEQSDLTRSSLMTLGANKKEVKYDDDTIIKSGFLCGAKILVTPSKSIKDNLIKNNHSSVNEINNSCESDESTLKFTSSTNKFRSRKNKLPKHQLKSISPDARSITTQSIDFDNITKSSSFNEDGFLINALGETFDTENIIPNKTNPTKTELEEHFNCSFEPENGTLCPEDITVIPNTHNIKRRHSLTDSSIDTINASQLISLNDSNSSNISKNFGRLFHTAYRSFRNKTKELREKQKTKPKITPPVSKIDDRTIYDDEIRKDELYKKALEEKAKRKQLVRARIYCDTKEEFHDSVEQVEVERLLLLSGQQEKAYLTELEMRDYEQYGTVMDKPVYGNVTISDIIVPVTQDVDTLDNIFSLYYIVVVSHKTQVFATEPLAAADRVVKFVKHKMVFENLTSDFKIKIEVYNIKVRKSIRSFSFESRYNINKDSNANISCPTPNGLILSPKAILRRIRHQNGLQSPEDSQFVFQGFLELDVNNINQKESFHLLRVPSYSIVLGEIHIKILSFVNLSSIQYSGLLSTVEDCGIYAPWNVKWCKLSGFYLHYWDDPKDEAGKEPIGTIDFRDCVTLESSNSEQMICGRRNTILIQTARFPKPNDRNTLLMTCTPQLTYVKHFFHATSASDLKAWKIRLQEVLNVLQQWNSTTVKKSMQITEV